MIQHRNKANHNTNGNPAAPLSDFLHWTAATQQEWPQCVQQRYAYRQSQYAWELHRFDCAEPLTAPFSFEQPGYLLFYLLKGSLHLQLHQHAPLPLLESQFVVLHMQQPSFTLELPKGKHQLQLFYLEEQLFDNLLQLIPDFEPLQSVPVIPLQADADTQERAAAILYHNGGLINADFFTTVVQLLRYRVLALQNPETAAPPEIAYRDSLEQIHSRIIAEPFRGSHKLYYLSKKYHIPEKVLRANFKKLYGIGIAEFTQLKIMERARHLLLHTHDSIDTIAQKIGYENGANFAKAFRKITGEAPKDFREKRS